MSIDLANLGAARLVTESDVEQKFVFPLLTAAEWLGIPESAIHTKHYLPPATIDKGAGRRVGYFPDYSVWLDAVPVLIVEAKSPNESFEEGFREAQHYAHEFNKTYRTGINPVAFVLSTNGRTVRFGNWDSSNVIDVAVADLKLGTAAHAKVKELLGFAALSTAAQRLRAKLRRFTVERPINEIGGNQTLNRRIAYNSFATELAPLIRMFFVSESAERIDEIIERAYVSSEEITKYDQILEIFLRDNIHQIQDPAAREITTTRRSEQLLTPEIRSYAKRLPATGQIQLLIGPVGAGKSLFCQRYYRFLQPDDVRKSCRWAFIDFNDAPDDLANAEKWVCGQFIKSICAEHPSSDLYTEENLRRIFAPDINRSEQMYAKARALDPIGWEMRLADDLKAWTNDSVKFAKEICRYLIGDARQAVAVVFDNVDKRDRDQQLRVFQIAQWFKAETRTFVVLPLRDETYEQHKNHPPLDAFINAIHFTITPPRFTDVVRKRLELSIAYLAEHAPEKLTYTLPDGKRILYPATKLGEYLKTLYLDIFRSQRRVSWLLEALAGRDVRKSLEMFTRLLMSGHLDERVITGTILGSSSFFISDTLIIKMLMKTDYLYFADDHGFVTNVFYCDPEWSRPSNFLIAEALHFLVMRRKKTGDAGWQGYFRVSMVLSFLNRMGFAPDDTLNGLTYLLAHGLITADHMRKRSLVPTDLVRAHASGFVHLRLLAGRAEYVSSVVPVTFMTDHRVAARLGRMWTINSGLSDIQVRRKQEIVHIFLEYLRDEYQRHCEESPIFENQAVGSRFLLRAVEGSIQEDRRSLEAPGIGVLDLS